MTPEETDDVLKLRNELKAITAALQRAVDRIAKLESDAGDTAFLRSPDPSGLDGTVFPARPVADTDAGSIHKSLETSSQGNQQHRAWIDGTEWAPKAGDKGSIRRANATSGGFEEEYGTLVKVRIFGTLASNEANINPTFATDNLTTEFRTFYAWIVIHDPETAADAVLNSGMCVNATAP